MRVFETWQTPQDVLNRTENKGVQFVAGKSFKRLQRPKQFIHKSKIKGLLMSTPVIPDTNIFVSVTWSPSAAEHALTNKLLLVSTLNKLIKDGYKEIPNFPYPAITTKPVYKIISKNLLKNGLYAFPVWPGPPSTPQAFDEQIWNACVYVSLTNKGKGNGKIDYGCKGPTPETTYNLSDFIYNTVTKQDSAYLTNELGLSNVNTGDYIILVAMHVGTREMKRWTWQTFWWEADPNKPFSPSSNAIAKAKPAQLKGAPRHYSMAVAYQMLQPAQPLTGGVNKGTPLFAYNPYLEAGFDPYVFQIFRPITTPTGILKTEYGIQTNCMTCHMLSQFNPANNYISNPGLAQTPYAADAYLDLDDPVFNGVLKMDFAWSIIGSVDFTK